MISAVTGLFCYFSIFTLVLWAPHAIKGAPLTKHEAPPRWMLYVVTTPWAVLAWLLLTGRFAHV